MSLPTLSVIIPVYNGEKYIESLFTSIIDKNDTFLSNMEILFIDDGSIDSSFKICQALSSNYSFVKTFHKENGGIASARNYGISKAIGKYITFCDQDDILNNGYSSFIDIIETSGSDILLSNYCINEKGIIKKINTINTDSTYNLKDIRILLTYFIGENVLITETELLQLNLPKIPLTIWNGLFRKQIIDDNNICFQKFVDYEDDWLFIISFLFASKKLCLTTEAYYCWSINPKSESHTRKYIPDFYNKRELLYEWTDKIVDSLPVSKDRVIQYKQKVKTQTAIWGFYNACNLALSQYLNVIKKQEKLYANISVGHFNIGRLSGFYLFLLKKKFYRLAYYINNSTFKRSYH